MLNNLKKGDTAYFVHEDPRNGSLHYTVYILEVGRKWLTVAKSPDADLRECFKVCRDTGKKQNDCSIRPAALYLNEAAYQAEQDFHQIRRDLYGQIQNLRYTAENAEKLKQIQTILIHDTKIGEPP